MTTWTHQLNKTLKISWPLTLGLLGQYLLGVVDSMMVGYHSTIELAASAFVNNLVGGTLVILIGFSTHVGVLVAQSLGRDGGRMAGRIARHGFVWNLALALALVLLLEFLNSHLEWFQQPKEVIAHAHSFLHFIAWSMLPFGLFNAVRQYSDGLQKTLAPMIIVVASVIINSLMNWFLIFGHGGAPELGLAGAGISTLITRTLMLIAVLILVLTSRRYKNYREQILNLKFEMHIFKSGFKIGAPSAFQYLFESGVFFITAFMMGWLGTTTLAANQVVMSLVSVLYMFPLSISIATSVRVGEATGRQDPHSARVIGFGSLYLSLIVTSACALFLIFGRFFLPHLFTSDLKVIAIAQDLFVIAGFFQIFDGTQCVLIGALRGMSDVKVPTFVMFISYWVIGISLAYFCGFTLGYGHVGIWTGLALSVVINALSLTYRFEYISKHRIRLKPV